MRATIAAVAVPVLALAAVFGGCRGGEHTPSPTASGAAQPTPSEAVQSLPTPVGTEPSIIGRIDQDDAFGKYLSAAAAFEIDVRTKEIYVYIGQRPPYLIARAADAPRPMNSADGAWNAGTPDELVISRRDTAPAPAQRSGPVYRIITPGEAPWSPTAHLLAFGSNVCGGGHLQLLDVDSGAVRDVTPDVRGALGYAWSPDGASIAVEASVASEPFTILLLDVAAGTSTTLVRVPPSRGGEFAPVAFDEDGGRLAFTYIPGRDFCQQLPPPTRLERLP